MTSFTKLYDAEKHLEMPKSCVPSGLSYDASNWTTLIGKRKYYRDLVRIFRGLVG